MLKILQITNKAPAPPDDGSSIAVYNMALGLVSNGAHLHLMAVNTKKHFKPVENVLPSFREQTHYKAVAHNTDVSSKGAILNLLSSESYFVSRFYFAEFERLLVEKLHETDFDIVQIEGVFMAVYLDVIRKNTNAKIVLRAHNVEYLIWERHLVNETSFFKKKYLQIQTERLKKFELQVLRNVDAIVSITDVDKEVFKNLTDKPVFNCITGLDLTLYRNAGDTSVKPKSVFYFASMDWLPNQQAVDWFLDNCWEKISARVPDATFIVAGKNMPERYKKVNARNVMIIPSVPNGREFYHQHDIMVVPLLSGSGLRIKIIEGMAYGKPIVSTSIGAEGIRVSSGKNILIADSPDDFADSVIKLLTEPELKNSLASEASAFAAKEFDNARVVSALMDFYKTLNV